eukprot:15426702-Alexandrium_andersonii.AAC.1
MGWQRAVGPSARCDRESYEGSHRLAGLGARLLQPDLRLRRCRPPGRADEARPRGGYRGVVAA